MKRSIMLSLMLVVLFASSFNHASAASSFKDISNSHAYLNQVQDLVKRGVISGYADDTFRPEEVVTRGQFAAFVSRALKLEKSTVNFKDVKRSMSLYDEIGKAATAGIIKGFADGSFKPNTPVTRADIAVMLDRAMQLKGSFKKTVTALDQTYNDSAKITGYSVESVKRMTAYGVMGATNHNRLFEPQTKGTRITTVVSIFNMLQVLEGDTSFYDIEKLAEKVRNATGAEVRVSGNGIMVISKGVGIGVYSPDENLIPLNGAHNDVTVAGKFVATVTGVSSSSAINAIQAVIDNPSAVTKVGHITIKLSGGNFIIARW